MAVSLKPFFDTNTLAPQSVLSVQRLGDAVNASYGVRHAKADAIRLEIEMLTESLTHLVEAEREYHVRTGVLSDRRVKDPYGSTSEPLCHAANREHILGGLVKIDPRTIVKESSAFPSSVPAVTLGISRALVSLGEVDRTLRLYSHRVRFKRLQIQVKIMELENMMKERQNAAAEPTA